MTLFLDGPSGGNAIPKDILAAAIAKRFPDGKCIDPGQYQFKGTVTFWVDLHISKAEPIEYRPTAELPVKKVLAIALAHAGVPREDVARIIREAAREVRDGGGKLADYMQATTAALDEAETLLGELPLKKREGQTRVSGAVEILSCAAAE